MLYRVRGKSMEPLYKEGSLLFALKLKPRVGDMVIVKDPRDKKRIIVKKLINIDRDGLIVEGINRKASTDSRTFGSVSPLDYVARVLFRLR